MFKDEFITDKSNYPNLYEIENEIVNSDKNNPFYNLLTASFEQIKLHERNKLAPRSENDFLVSIETNLEPGKVNLSQLGTVANGLQRIFTTLINDVVGKGNIKGLIPKIIVDSSQLIVNSVTPGSFNMHINSNSDVFVNEIMAEEQLDRIHKMFARITKEDPSFIIEEIGFRTFTVSKHWFEQLNKEEISFSVIKDLEEIRIDRNTINGIHTKFNDIKSKVLYEDIEVIGVLDSANRSTTTLRILKEDETSILAKAELDLFSKGLVIGVKKYNFKLNKIIVQNISSNQIKETYKVIGIDEI